jgi:NADPH:quinone reductase-like Zn-dependent oxidoreductase
MQATLEPKAPTLSRGTHPAPTLPGQGLMRAMVHEKYGSFDGLGIKNIQKPTAKDGEVVVRVRAAGLHVGDCFAVRGAPYLMRVSTGLFRPKPGIPGFDVAGIVESVGKDVQSFKPGDEVFGAGMGTCADYVSVSESTLAPKPVNLTFEAAASMPTSALAALHALRDVAKIKPGQPVMINGASGGIGTFAVQIAKSMGAEVTGVCSGRNVDLVRSLGADHVIDYTQDDFTRGNRQYDLIFDNVENRTLADCRRVLTPSGTYIPNSGTGAEGMAMFVRLLKPILLSPFVSHSLKRYLSVANQADLMALKELTESGKLTPVIDGTYPLPEVATALAHIEAGHARGKVVVTVSGTRLT